jgi:glutamine synthetase
MSTNATPLPTSPAARADEPLPGERELRGEIDAGRLREIEVAWPDQLGHPRGKRIPADVFLARARGAGFTFCDAALTWDHAGEVLDGARLTRWETGYGDLFAVPDLTTLRLLPWRPGTGQVVADVVDHHRELIRTAPRTVLRRVLDHLAALGYQARAAIELEFHLLGPSGAPLSEGVQAYSLQKLAELDPVLDQIVSGLHGFVPVEGAHTEYGPGQVEVNLVHAPALEAADDGFRLKAGVRELARRGGATATFMAKPFAEYAGNSMHVHISLWRDGAPAFAPEAGAEPDLMRAAIGGVVRHLPGITLFGAPTVNSFKRFEAFSFAPTTVSWGGDNRTVAVRSLIETPSATRIEWRAGASDAEPHWAIAALLAAAVAGIEDGDTPPPRGDGNEYERGEPLPASLDAAIGAVRADRRIVEILGEDAVHDYLLVAEAEWRAFVGHVGAWDRERYLTSA